MKDARCEVRGGAGLREKNHDIGNLNGRKERR